MINKVLLISENYVKSQTQVYDNVDPKLIEMYIYKTQNDQLKDLLPDDLYDDTFEQMNDYRDYYIANSGGTSGSTLVSGITDFVETRLLNLIDECKPMIAYYTLYNAAYSLYNRITNKGITNQSSQYSATADWKSFEFMRGDWKNMGELYAARVNEYMYDNISTYPEYSCGNDAFSSSVYLGDNI